MTDNQDVLSWFSNYHFYFSEKYNNCFLSITATGLSYIFPATGTYLPKVCQKKLSVMAKCALLLKVIKVLATNQVLNVCTDESR